MNNIVFGITTYDSIDFVSRNLDILINEIIKTSFEKKEVIISSNGNQNYECIEEIITELQLKYKNIKIELINSKTKGKNKALNIILLCSDNDDICYFLDDDVIVDYKTIESNIRCLIVQRNVRNIPIIVGPNFKASNHNNTIFQKVISVPYRINSPNSPFVMGAALTFYRKDFGLYIEDENIADDGYIGNYFLKYLYDNKLLNEPSNIVKDGFAYFHLSNSYKSWKKQQIRILIGVDNSYKCFGYEYENYFKSMCKWEYSFGKDLRKPLRRNFSILLYRMLQYLVMREVLNSPTTEVQWENISSTKKL